MVSNVNSVSTARFLIINKPPDEEPVIEVNAVKSGVSDTRDRLEISNEAHTASINTQAVVVKPPTRDFMEIFSVNIWSLGLEEQKQ